MSDDDGEPSLERSTTIGHTTIAEVDPPLIQHSPPDGGCETITLLADARHHRAAVLGFGKRPDAFNLIEAGRSHDKVGRILWHFPDNPV
jgi:hypothetical protein